MKVGLLGGAFNPPHLGHVFVARQAMDFAGLDEVWFLPNYRQSPPKPVAPVEDRLAMTRLLTAPGMHVSTIEIDNALDGQTIHVLPHLPAGNDYRFIIGSDQLAAFHLWGSWQELLKRIPFLVFPRYGYPNEPLYENMDVVAHEGIISCNISSTKIRERVRLGLSIREFVPAGVAAYIAERKLYL